MNKNPNMLKNWNAIIPMAGFLSLLLASCGSSPRSVVDTYLKTGTYSKERYKLICEKKYVSPSEFTDFYQSPMRTTNQDWKTTEIREIERVGNKVYIEADHLHNGKTFTPMYLVVNRKEGGPCVSWTEGGRFPVRGTRLVRYPSDKITIWAKVELSDYYNYDFNDSQWTHMALRIIDGTDGWDWKTVYIPYDGNEDLYDHISTNNQSIVKMTVSREYTLNLDSGAVDSYNQALYNVKSSFDELSSSIGSTSSYEPNYLNYDRSYITRDKDILFAPTAAPVILR